MNRLRAYRAIEQMTQEQLGTLLSISPSMVSSIESGRRLLSESIDLAPLDYSPRRFELPEMSTPLHRQRASTTVASTSRAQELLRLAGEVYVELRLRTERIPPITVDRLPPPQSMEQLEEFALTVRYQLHHEEGGPIRNLTAAVERAGVCLIPISDLPGIDGLSSWVAGVPVIGIAPNIPGDRFRSTLAHELAHLLFHIAKTEQSEHEALRFAGALLMPRTEFDNAMPERPQLRDFIALKSSWGLAVSALVYRAWELDYIDDARFRALQVQMSKWKKSEPATFSPVYGQMLPHLMESHGGVDSVGQQLGLNRQHLAEIVRWQHLRVA
jgi:Zn-dependent peptidase ImmA (M78 family)